MANIQIEIDSATPVRRLFACEGVVYSGRGRKKCIKY